MARTTCAVPYIDPLANITYQANSILSGKGFVMTECDDEKVWCRTNEDFSLTEFVKFDYMTDVFIFSVWIKLNDSDPYREYNLEYFGNKAKETKILRNAVSELYGSFEGSLIKKEVYIWRK